ncbi:MAG: hybrid sensor histidine kinase/response regulator [Desulfatiglandales bacterium]
MERFNRDQAPLLRGRVNIILLLGCLIVPLFGVLDYLLYPDLFGRFMMYRLIASASCLLLYTCNRKWNLRLKSSFLGIIGYYIVGLSIIKMITETGGYNTIYYAGLNLIYLGFCTVLPLATRTLAFHCLVLYVVYVCSVLFFSPVHRPMLFLGNNLFIVSTLIIVLLASRVNHAMRFREFLLRLELRRMQHRLQTYSKSLETSVVESEERYRLVVDHANDAIFIVQDDIIRFPNPKTRELLGYTEDELGHLSFQDLVYKEDRPWVLEQYRQLLTAEPAPSIAPFRVTNKPGDILWVDMGSVPIKWKGCIATIHFLRDITERRILERELIQAQKMEAIGTLAGGIAHDFNNLLQVISGYLQVIFMDKSSDDPDYHALSQMEKSVQRAAALTKQLLVYGRKVESELKPVDLNQVITRVSSLMERVIPKMIALDMHLSPDLRKINADPTQLEQIIMNLIVNSRDALPDGGKIIIETKNFLMDEEFCKRHADVSPGAYACLSISDTGQGMDQQTLDRIFDPFFTTKEKGKGTGLGLAIVFSIVKSHRGTVLCRSRQGTGTVFDIYLPAASLENDQEKALDATEESLSGRNETILFVDDDLDLLDLTQSMLEAYNYRALRARSGEEAIEILKRERDVVDLVILDLNMPGMGGAKCLKELLSIEPSVKVIIATGYLDDGQKDELLREGAAAYVGKPYKFQTILKEIKRQLSFPAR